MKATQRGESVKRYDVAKLNINTTREDFRIECGNRFIVLDALEESDQSVDERWNDIRTIYQTAGKEIPGFKAGHGKKWISDSTWDLI